MIDTSLLQKTHGADLPADLQEALQFMETHFQKQNDKVVSVNVLPNCNVDYDRTLHLQNTLSDKIKWVLQGVVVQVKEDYKLSYEDAVWFHPEMAKGRSVYRLDNVSLNLDDLKQIKEYNVNKVYPKSKPNVLSAFHNSVGLYSNIKIDDMGMAEQNNHLVLNISMDALTYPLWSRYLVANEQMGKVYKDWVSMDIAHGKSISDMSKHVRDTIAATITKQSSIKPIYSDEINSLYTDGTDIYCSNNAIKNPNMEEASVLVHISPLGGYELFQTSFEQNFIPADTGLSEKTFHWNEMSVKQRQRIFNDCAWEGKEGFNTYVLKTSGMNKNIKKNFESLYKLYNSSRLTMTCAKFSSQPVRDFMQPHNLLHLTPQEHHMEGVTNMEHARSGEHIEIPIKMSYQTFEKLVTNFEKIQETHPEFQLFNEKICKNGYIQIPREVLKSTFSY